MGNLVLFQQLAGQRATIANYPGAMVEVSWCIAQAFMETVVVDAPGLLTLSSVPEEGRPMILVLNMTDGANSRGMVVNNDRLADFLSLPVISPAATEGRVIDDLKAAITAAEPAQIYLNYSIELRPPSPKSLPIYRQIPLRHGYVNLTINDSKWLFDIASVGRLVHVHN